MVREIKTLRQLLTDLTNDVADHMFHGQPLPSDSFIAARDYVLDQLHAYNPKGL
jgi:hypothetical protein